MLTPFKKHPGFTIVELLIVIVVIAILATISVVAYNGVQNRANDTAIQSDIANLVKKIRLYEAENGVLPTPGSKATPSPSSTIFPGITFSPSKPAYAATEDNLFYCSGTKSGVSTFAIAARSKSKTIFGYRPEDGAAKPVAVGAYTYCMDGFDTGTGGYSYGYYKATDTWWSWTNG